LKEAETRLGQDEEPSVQSTIHDEKLRRLDEKDFDFNIFLDNPYYGSWQKDAPGTDRVGVEGL
jgi:hypothetical protein